MTEATFLNRISSYEVGWIDRFDQVAQVLGFYDRSPGEGGFASAVAQWQASHPPLAPTGHLDATSWQFMDVETRFTLDVSNPLPRWLRGDSWGDRSLLDSAIHSLRSQLATAGVFRVLDATARAAYDRQISAMAADLAGRASSGQITWAEAARQANEARNEIMEAIRWRSSPSGRAMAQRMKAEGKTLNELIARKVLQIFGNDARFDRLTSAQPNSVYSEVVRSAGKSNPAVTARMRTVSRAGKGLIVLSLAISVYVVATADDPWAAAGREATVTSAGVVGGMAAGALAGLACGPGAPACVTIGAFVGGALVAFGVDYAFFD